MHPFVTPSASRPISFFVLPKCEITQNSVKSAQQVLLLLKTSQRQPTNIKDT